MGISRYVFVAVLACCAIGGLQAANEAPRHQKKLYINEQTITVTKEGIEVNTKEGIIKVKTLRSDRKGVFVTAQDVCKGDGRYYCRGCGLRDCKEISYVIRLAATNWSVDVRSSPIAML